MNTQKQSLEKVFNFHTDFYDQYADDAAFLWLLREKAVLQPDYDFNSLRELDERIDTKLNALMTAPDDAWGICEKLLDLQQPGEVFVASVIAFHSLDVRKIQKVVEIGLADPFLMKGLVSALAWLPGRLVHSWVKKFLTSKDLNHKFLAMAVCGARREDPHEYLSSILKRDDCRDHQKLYARALRLIGELKRFDLLPYLEIPPKSCNTEVQFWSHWSHILLGDKNKSIQLEKWIMEENPFRQKAIEIGFRSLSSDVARVWITRMINSSVCMRIVIQAARAFGDPQAINWLLLQMRIPHLTRCAGEAFSTITGIDLKDNNLVLNDVPNLDDLLPNDGAQNEDLEMSEDQDLPFPDTDKVAAVWQKYQHRFSLGSRYFMGNKLVNNAHTSDYLRQIYASGTQRQRAAAALHLSLLEPAQFLLNHAAKENIDR